MAQINGISSKNPFNPPLNDKNLSRDEKKQKAVEATQETINAARACINTEVFQIYKKKYAKTREKIIDVCIDLKTQDPLLYAFEIANYMATLRSIGALLDKVENEARI